MTKQEIINAVLKNPSLACEANLLKCYGGYDAGEGHLEYSGKWMFIRGSATGRSFEPTDEFIEKVISDNWRKLLRLYR